MKIPHPSHNGASLCAEIKSRLGLRDAARMAGCNDLPERDGVKFCSPIRPDRNPSCTIKGEVMTDWSEGKHFDAIALFAALTGRDNAEAIRELGDRLGLREAKAAPAPRPKPQPPPSPKIEPAADLIEKPITATDADFEAVRATRLLPEGTGGMELAHTLGVLRFGTVCGFRCWIVTDTANRVAEARRLDGELFPQQGTLAPRKAHTLKGSKKSWPAGIAPKLPPERLAATPFALVEGGPDLLAAFCVLAAQPASLPDVQPVAMLGASQSIAADALPLFASRPGVVLAHGDDAGREAARRWARQLAAAGCRVTVRRLPEGKDLNDLSINRDPAELAALLQPPTPSK